MKLLRKFPDLQYFYHRIRYCKGIWASTRENLSPGFSIKKGATLATCTNEISIFKLVSVAEETGMSLALSETPKTGFVA